MASWGNGREEARLLLGFFTLPTRQRVQQESPKPGLPLSWRCLQSTAFCDLTWHIQGCNVACGALKILSTSQTLGMVSGQTSGNFY